LAEGDFWRNIDGSVANFLLYRFSAATVRTSNCKILIDYYANSTVIIT